jgi:hypothetical protein
MIIIQHRINTIEGIVKVDKKRGVEIDLRSYKNDLILEHEPFVNSVSFASWLDFFNHKFLIANIKEERIEFEVIKLLKAKKIENFFLLDTTIPMIHNLNKEGFFNIALRCSHYESSDNYISLVKNKIFNKWLWLDTINGLFPISLKKLIKLKDFGYNVCLVCPQLPLGATFALEKFEHKYSNHLNYVDAVCTKNTNFWSKYEN